MLIQNYNNLLYSVCKGKNQEKYQVQSKNSNKIYCILAPMDWLIINQKNTHNKKRILVSDS